jgi:hypothetical protein
MANQFNKLLMEEVNKHGPAKDQELKGRQTPKPYAALEMRDNARSKGQKEKLQSLRRECQMI